MMLMAEGRVGASAKWVQKKVWTCNGHRHDWALGRILYGREYRRFEVFYEYSIRLNRRWTWVAVALFPSLSAGPVRKEKKQNGRAWRALLMEGGWKLAAKLQPTPLKAPALDHKERYARFHSVFVLHQHHLTATAFEDRKLVSTTNDSGEQRLAPFCVN